MGSSWTEADRLSATRQTRRPRRALLIGLIGAAATVIALVALAIAAGRSLPRGTTIGGVAVGGLSRTAAIERLEAAVAAAAAPLPVQAEGRSATLIPAAAGLTVDAAASVDAVLGAGLRPQLLRDHLLGGSAALTLPRPERAAIVAALAPAQRAIDVPSADGGITFSADGPTARPAVSGITIDIAAAADVVARSWLDRREPVTLPVRTSAPVISQAEVERAMTEVAVPASSGPLQVAVGATTLTVPMAALAPTLSMRATTAEPPALDLVVDGAKLRAAVLALDSRVERPPVDASVVLRDGAPVVVPAVEGTRIDPAAVATAAAAGLLREDRRATLTPVTAKPARTTEQAKAWGVTERVSTFSTELTSNVPRTENLKLAAKGINGTLVLPGETFSMNTVLGKRTPEKGYQQAPVINGGRLTLDYGGGVSQMATTIYNNVFFAGLQDVRHMAHSFHISRYPEGREATVSYPTVDLQWRNNSPHAVLIEASVTSTVNVSFWSTKVYDKVVAEKSERTNVRQPRTIVDSRDSCVPQEPNPGFDVVVTRKLYRGGALVGTQSWTTQYLAEDKVTCT